jgi:hypothetical protein
VKSTVNEKPKCTEASRQRRAAATIEVVEAYGYDILETTLATFKMCILQKKMTTYIFLLSVATHEHITSTTSMTMFFWPKHVVHIEKKLWGQDVG